MNALEYLKPGQVAPTADEAYRFLLDLLLREGSEVAPRGQRTVEVLHHVSLAVDLNHPVITNPARRLNYRFMAAEALWMIEGRNDLEPLTRFNKRMAEFSDDGLTLAGAYGPRLKPQLPYVVRCLVHDRDTRQAALTIWTPSPAPSKDIPCTVAMVFSIRKDRLYQQVFMRSSDAWLGIPYDIFSFAMVAAHVACLHNQVVPVAERVGLGHLTLTATSSHLYERDWPRALETVHAEATACPVVSAVDVRQGRWDQIASLIAARRDGSGREYPL